VAEGDPPLHRRRARQDDHIVDGRWPETRWYQRDYDSGTAEAPNNRLGIKSTHIVLVPGQRVRTDFAPAQDFFLFFFTELPRGGLHVTLYVTTPTWARD